MRASFSGKDKRDHVQSQVPGTSDNPLYCLKVLDKEHSEVAVSNLNKNGVCKVAGGEVVIPEGKSESSREQAPGINERRMEKYSM